MNINIFHFSDLSSAAFTLPMQTIDVWFFKTEDFPPDAQDTQILSTEERNRIACYSQGKTVSSIRLRAFSYVCCLENICTSHRKNLCFVQAHMANFIWIMMHLQSEVWDICHGFPLISLIRKSRLRLHFPFLPRSVSTSKKIRENARSSHLVHRFFHPDEELRFAHLPEWESTQLFFRYWTIREAFLKGIGTGFTISADSFRIDEINSDSGLYQLTKYPLWRVQALPAPDKYFCSVAYCVQNPL